MKQIIRYPRVTPSKEERIELILERRPEYVIEVVVLVETAPKGHAVTPSDIVAACDCSLNAAHQRAFWAVHAGLIDRPVRGQYYPRSRA